ncbi:PKD domain-containing protein [Cytophagaceae bacterium YF14B1]|uniref:PKD domain-containing protein n=1 Tax=Xanthocytophaga flava TaxID=3048013 RepID=A0AAE3QQ89_9BACT|nr:PKD domain-containing protein [Xanthocytophaga flavus]MDJ1483487.1 PKD domain-containing protein [Xanthocytophaga flavus]
MKKVFKFLCLVLLIACSNNDPQPDPIAKFTAVVQGSQIPATVVFTNVSENADSYEWDFGDGEGSVEKDPTHVYNKSGQYIVSLIAIRGNKKSNPYTSSSFKFTGTTTPPTTNPSSGCGTHNGKPLYKGPQGGCYYINSNGNKTYVDRSECKC